MVLLAHKPPLTGILLSLVHATYTYSRVLPDIDSPSWVLTDPSSDRPTVSRQTLRMVEVDFRIRLEDHYNFYRHVHLSFPRALLAQVRRIYPFHHQPSLAPYLLDLAVSCSRGSGC